MERESQFVGQSGAFLDAVERTSRAAPMQRPVLIIGERGTGKELIAERLHRLSNRWGEPMITMNCAALPETLIEAELFGHEAGAFTNAQRRRIGKLEHAQGGTLFLDEIEAMPLVAQVKLLRALQERYIERLGANERIDIDVRVVAATKQDLAELSEQGKFRQDLYFRLNVVELFMPPLRERREDIPLLFEHFLLRAASRYHREAPLVSAELLAKLRAHDWPGNVRELRNVADRHVLDVQGRSFLADSENAVATPLSEQVEAFERSVIVDQLRRNKGSVAMVSEALKIPKKTLYDKIRKYKLSVAWFR